MRILVLGGGIVGITTAWELQQDGHEVTVLEAAAELAQGTSFANGGQIAVSESAPWSRPGLSFEVLKNLFRDAPYKLRLRADPAQWQWLYQFWRNCDAEAHRRGARRNWKLAQYSQQCLQKTRSLMANDFNYDDRQAGILQLVGPGGDVPTMRRQMEELDDSGKTLSWLPPDALVQQEPALRHAIDSGEVIGAIWGMADESGDAAKFTKLLAAEFQQRGGRIEVNCPVGGFVTGRRNGQEYLIAVQTPNGDLAADAAVMCTGIGSAALGKLLRLSLPILPMKGYSLTVPVTDVAAAPVASLTDLSHRLVISRLGDRLRAAGYAEIGMGPTLDPKRVNSIKKRMQTLFPDAADYALGEGWTGFRPMTPDGAPIIGRTGRLNNFWLNTGHGTLGWTLSHGTARLLADMIAGKQTAQETTPFAVHRPYIPARHDQLADSDVAAD